MMISGLGMIARRRSNTEIGCEGMNRLSIGGITCCRLRIGNILCCFCLRKSRGIPSCTLRCVLVACVTLVLLLELESAGNGMWEGAELKEREGKLLE